MPYVALSSPIRRRSRSLGSGHKGCFKQMSFEMFPECLNSKSKSFGTWQIDCSKQQQKYVGRIVRQKQNGPDLPPAGSGLVI